MGKEEIGNESILLESLPDLKRVHVFEEIDSTSDFAKQLKIGPDELPALIYARRQTKGRGRGSKKWVSNDDSMTFSFLLDPTNLISPNHSSIVWGVALAATLNEIADEGNPFQIKWPNDVMAHKSKVAGILIESVLGDSAKQVVGIGINLQNNSQQLEGESAAADIKAISVREVTGRRANSLELLRQLWFSFVRHSRFALTDLLNEYQKLDYLRSSTVQLQVGDQVVCGEYRGVADDGSLQILVEGEMLQFQSASVLNVSWPSDD